MTSTTPHSDKGWFWKVAHERDGWPSSTKLMRLGAFLVVTGLILWFAYKDSVPTGIAELIYAYLAYAVGQRVASQWGWSKEKENRNVDSGS